MTTYLFDTCVLIDHLRHKPEAVAFFDALIKTTPDPFLLSVLSVHELYTGMRPDEIERTELLLGEFTILPLGRDEARHSGELMQRYGKSHGLDSHDAMIAATAKSVGAKLITRNLKHFPMFSYLERPY